MGKNKGIMNRIAVIMLLGILTIDTLSGSLYAAETEPDSEQSPEISVEAAEDSSYESAEEASIDESVEEMPGDMEVSEADISDTSIEETAENDNASVDISDDVIGISTNEEVQNASDDSQTYYTVTLDANGGYFVDEWDDSLNAEVERTEVLNKIIPSGGSVPTIPIYDAEKANMVFVGWSLELDGEITLQSGDNFFPIEDCTLFAVWEESVPVNKDGSPIFAEDDENGNEVTLDLENSNHSSTAENNTAEIAEESEIKDESEVISDDPDNFETVPGSSDEQSQSENEDFFTDTDTAADEEEQFDYSASPEDTNALQNGNDHETNLKESNAAIDTQADTNQDLIENDPMEASVSSEAVLGAVSSGKCGDNLTWTLDAAGTFTISGKGEMTDYGSASNIPWHEYGSGNQDIKKVVVEEGVTKLCDYCFDNCQQLSNVSLPDSLTVIGKRCFGNCCKLEKIQLSDNILTIGEYAFEYCHRITSIRLPEEITIISNYLFSSCTSLKSISIGKKVNSLSYEAFVGCSSLEQISVDPDNKYYTDLKGVLFNKGMDTLIKYPAGKDLSSYEVPAGTKYIGHDAFDRSDNLTSLRMADSVVTIYHNGIYGCKNLKTLYLGKTLGYVGLHAIESCESLTSLVFPSSLYCLDSCALSYDTSLNTITFRGDAPSCADLTFRNVSATVYYPEDKASSYDSLISKNYQNADLIWETYELNRPDIANCNITLSATSYYYDGYDKKPVVTIMDGEQVLSSDYGDYSVRYNNNCNAGTAEVMIQGKNDYTGSVTKNFTILKAAPKLVFTSPSLTKKQDDNSFSNQLSKVTDGSITFSSSNTDVAEVHKSNGLVTIKGPGTTTITANAAAGVNYASGSASYELTVENTAPLIDVRDAWTVTLDKPNGYMYTGKAIKPEVTVTEGTKVLEPEVDYTVTLNNNIELGQGAVVIVPTKPGYENCIEKSFIIKDKYTVTYDANGGFFFEKWSTTIDSANKETITTKEFAPGSDFYDPNAAVYSFDPHLKISGWSLTKNGPILETDFDNPNRYKVNSDMTVYAVWDKAYVIRLNANGGEFNVFLYMDYAFDGFFPYNDGVSLQVWEGKSFNLPTPEDEYYSVVNKDKTKIFAGWGLSPDGENVAKLTSLFDDEAPEDNFSSLYYQPKGDCTLYALWKDCYTIKLDANGGGDFKVDLTFDKYDSIRTTNALTMKCPCGSPMGSAKADYSAFTNEVLFGFDYELIPNDKSRDLLGWSTSKNGKPFNLDSYIPKTNCTLYAIWSTPIEEVSVTGLAAKKYTGKAIVPNLILKNGDTTLKAGTDYKITYKNNIKIGTASVVVTGIGKYSGTITKNFKITKAAQSITAKSTASSIAVGKTATVSITGNKGTKSYKSSNTAIATVTSAGKVTAKKVGTVKITATSAATSTYNAASKTVTIKVVPAATASITAANQATGIKLTWKKVAGANGYRVYRGSTLIKKITSGSTLTFTDTKANTNGTKYTFKIIPTATTGNGTAKSIAIYRLVRPVISSATNSASKRATVKWGKNAKATGYQIQYSTSKTFASGNKTVTIAKVSTVSRVLTSLVKGKTYYVRMRTYKTVGSNKYYSLWSAKKSVKIIQ